MKNNIPKVLHAVEVEFNLNIKKKKKTLNMYFEKELN